MIPPKKWKKSECPICKGTGCAGAFVEAAHARLPCKYPCDHKDRRKGERRVLCTKKK